MIDLTGKFYYSLWTEFAFFNQADDICSCYTWFNSKLNINLIETITIFYSTDGIVRPSGHNTVCIISDCDSMVRSIR